MSTRAASTAAAFLALMVLLGACGGGGNTKTTKIIPAEQFKLDADTACEKRADFLAKLDRPRTLDDYAEQGKRVVRADTELLEALEDADPPATVRPQFGRYLAAQRKLNAINAQRTRAAEAGDRSALNDAAYTRQRAPLRAEQRTIARRLGLLFCGSS